MKYISDQNQWEYHLAYGGPVIEAAAESGQEVPLPFPQELGEGRATFCLFSDNLGYGILDITEAAESGKIAVRATDNFIKLTLHMSSGSSFFNVDGFSKTLSVGRGDGYILSGPAFGHIDISKGDRLREFSLFVSECKFHEMNEELQLRWSGEMERELFSLSQRRGYLKSPTGVLSGMATLQLLQCPLEGAIRRFYLDTKLHEILALRLFELYEAKGNIYVSNNLSAADRRHLEEARDILKEEAVSPPSIPELARRVGLNTTKLKRGFRECYGTTLFEFVRQVRMESAYTLLLEEGLSVSETALFVGYSSFSAFTKAFSRYFGFLPGLLSRQNSHKIP